MCAAIDRDRWRVSPVVPASPFGATGQPRGTWAGYRSAAPPSGPAVLLVEACPFQRVRLSRLLAGSKIVPYVATDADGAVDIFRHVVPEMVLVNVEAATAGGLAVAERIRGWERQRGATRSVPVVALVSSEWSCDWRALRQAGVTALLDRGFGAPELKRCLRRWCQPAPVAGPTGKGSRHGARPWTAWFSAWMSRG